MAVDEDRRSCGYLLSYVFFCGRRVHITIISITLERCGGLSIVFIEVARSPANFHP